MVEFLRNLVKNDALATILMSLMPLIELKGGIVFARGVGYSFFEALGLSYIGSTIAFVPVFFFAYTDTQSFKKDKVRKKIRGKNRKLFYGQGGGNVG